MNKMTKVYLALYNNDTFRPMKLPLGLVQPRRKYGWIIVIVCIGLVCWGLTL